MKNLIFYFTGTGNSLKVAKEIQNNIDDCQIISMGNESDLILKTKYDSIGFIYPTYMSGIPLRVANFASSLDIFNNRDTYCYLITTYGGNSGNALPQLSEILREKGLNVSYSAGLKMFSNAVILYDMSEKVEEITLKSDKNLLPIIDAIKTKDTNSCKKSNGFFSLVYRLCTKNMYLSDKNYNISNDCISCNTCADVCPVNNIELIDGKPTFKHHCEKCLACIQYCSKKAINYKNKTQNRRRYRNPSISAMDLAECNSKKYQD